MTVTVDAVVTSAKQKADMVNSNFVKAAEWISYVNYSWKELYDILVAKFEDYYTSVLTFTLTGGQNSQALPADFYKMRGVDRAISGTEYYTLRPFTFEDRNNRRRVTLYRGLYPTIRYRVFGDAVIFTPDDAADGNYRFFYIPRAQDLTAGTDTIDGVNGWEDYVAVDAAIKALIKEETDASALMMQKQALLQRINDMGNNRDAGESERVTDVTTSGYDNVLFTPGDW